MQSTAPLNPIASDTVRRLAPLLGGLPNGDLMIHRYDHTSLALWEHGDIKVKIVVPTSERPVAYCDGTEEDERELRAIAEEEGTELPTIKRKVLKTGREIWTIGEPPTDEVEEDW